jgi:hypothetical protein
MPKRKGKKPPGEEMFNYHGCSGPCPKPPLPPARTVQDAILEAELLMTETFEQLDPDNERDSWFMVRITKIREALADRPH